MTKDINKDFLWVEKYRPKTVDECILPDDLKNTFQQFVNQNNVPNLLLSGGPGVGKTTIAKAMLDELKCDYIIVNGSMNGNIDTLRYEIRNFASAVSFSGGRKYVILDEADYLNANSTQPALRNFMEEYSKNCGFILTCNFKNRIIQPLHSRCSVIDFTIPISDRPLMAKNFWDRLCNILSEENVVHDTKVVAEFINKHFPDWRRVLNELQRYSSTGAIDSGILSRIEDVSIDNLIEFLKNKKFTDMRKWVAQNIDQDSTVLFRKIYDKSNNYITTNTIPKLVLILADYQYKSAFAADQEINTVACLTEIMVQCEFQ
tara:strand:- start:1293 stop:2243 length:951 start_codon:yes stop_codon:yes gene_type:complete